MKVQPRPLSNAVLPCSVICLLETVVKTVKTIPVCLPEQHAGGPRHEKAVVRVLCGFYRYIFRFNYEKYLQMVLERQGPEPYL